MTSVSLPSDDGGFLSDDILIGPPGGTVRCNMLPASLLDDLSPHARVATAIAPFLLAISLRLMFGKNRVTQVLLSISTTWFAINILMTPYSANMRDDLQEVRSMFR